MAKIILKKSNVASKVPVAGDLDYGELALNYTDGKLWYKNNSNVITQLNAGLAGTVTVAQGGTGLTAIGALSIAVANTANTYTTVTPTAGQSIRINAGNTAWEAYTPSNGGSGTPGGSDTNIQYNNAGSFGGNADFTYNATTRRLQLIGTDTEIEMQAITTEPAIPAAGRILIYSKSIGGRIMPKFMGPSGFDTAVQASIAQNKVSLYNPTGNSNVVPVIFGHNFTATGTATARNIATTNVFSRAKRIGYVTAATANNIAGLSNPTTATGNQYTVGTGTVGVGGFYLIIRFGISNAATLATQITFVGLTAATTAPAGQTDPATFINSIGIGTSSGDTNLRLFYGGSAAQTPIALGALFPGKTISTDWYELILFSPANVNNVVSYRVVRLNTNDSTEGTITAATPGTQLPLSTTLLGIRAFTANNAVAQAVGIDIGTVYMETDI